MLECNRHGIAISPEVLAKSANKNLRKTMLAIGKTYEEAKQYVRFSFGQQTTKDQIDTTIHALHTIGNQFYRGVKS